MKRIRPVHLLIGAILVFGILCMVMIERYINPRTVANQDQQSLEQRMPLTHDFGKIVKYKITYMGDASNTINLNNQLPLGFVGRNYELDSKVHKLIIKFDGTVSAIGEQTVKQAVIYNGAANFALISNMEAVEFRFKDRAYLVKRADIEEFLGSDLKDLGNSDNWKQEFPARIQDDEAVNRFIAGLSAP